MILRPNFHVNISEQFTIRECMRRSFETSVNMDLEDVDEDDYLRKEASCSKTRDSQGYLKLLCQYKFHKFANSRAVKDLGKI